MSSSVFVILTVLATSIVWSETLVNEKRWDFVDGPWVKAQPRPPTPTWPDQFVTGFYMYIQKLGKGFKSKGSVYYDYTEKVTLSAARPRRAGGAYVVCLMHRRPYLQGAYRLEIIRAAGL